MIFLGVRTPYPHPLWFHPWNRTKVLCILNTLFINFLIPVQNDTTVYCMYILRCIVMLLFKSFYLYHYRWWFCFMNDIYKVNDITLLLPLFPVRLYRDCKTLINDTWMKQVFADQLHRVQVEKKWMWDPINHRLGIRVNYRGIIHYNAVFFMVANGV